MIGADLLLLAILLRFEWMGTSSQPSTIPVVPRETSMTHHVSGPFEVKGSPLPPYNQDDKALGRMSIDKQFHGDLEATSKGEMLSARTEVKGSAGYVAIEKVSGSLNGRTGTFVLEHFATMTRGTPQLTIIVVPDSGTGQLVGLSGTMNIIIASGGKHSYEFDYLLPDGKGSGLL